MPLTLAVSLNQCPCSISLSGVSALAYDYALYKSTFYLLTYLLTRGFKTGHVELQHTDYAELKVKRVSCELQV